jgi:hypothetical protein
VLVLVLVLVLMTLRLMLVVGFIVHRYRSLSRI